MNRLARTLSATCAAAVVISLALALGAARAEDKKDDKEQPIKGTWTKEADGVTIAFQFKTKDQLVVKASAGGNGATVICKYTVEKDVVKAEVTEVMEEGDFPAKPPKGYTMSFRFKVTKDMAKLDEYKADKPDNTDEVKPIIEGEYKVKKAD